MKEIPTATMRGNESAIVRMRQEINAINIRAIHLSTKKDRDRKESLEIMIKHFEEM